MQLWRWFVIVVLSFVTLYSIELSPDQTHRTLLPHAQLYIDHNRSATIETIHTKPFHSITQESIGFGYAPDLDIWIKITLNNPTDQSLQKILEYSSPLATYIELYDGQRYTLLAKEGLLHNPSHRQTLNPYFELSLKAHEQKIYYLKVSSLSALVIRLDLWQPRAFYDHSLSMRALFALFLGAMLMIIFYNLIIYFVTKEISYLYYVLFFAAITFHQFSYRGALLFIFTEDTIRLLIDFATFVVAMPVFFLMLFTKEVLHLKQYPQVNSFLTVLLLLYPLSIVWVHLSGLHHLRAVLSVSMLFVLFVITLYALYHKNRQARYLILGWALLWTAALCMLLANIGVYDIFIRIPFYVEWVLIAKALIFSLSLAMMIKQINQDKLEVQAKYITLQTEKEQQLTQKVAERTQQLSQSLQEKDLLLKELNHRVKNSIQTIVSFLRLQIDETEDTSMRQALTHIENRILSINHLYALLNTKEHLSHIDAHAYFSLLVSTIQSSFQQHNIRISIDTAVQLSPQTAIYCGFILNEALTNALQHAFDKEDEGEIKIILTSQKRQYLMQIKDNGRGFDSRQPRESLGLSILESLATFQLKGTLHIDTTQGTVITVRWREKDA